MVRWIWIPKALKKAKEIGKERKKKMILMIIICIPSTPADYSQPAFTSKPLLGRTRVTLQKIVCVS